MKFLKRLLVILSLAAILSGWIAPYASPAYAREVDGFQRAINTATENIPSLASFARSVQNGRAQMAVGVYVPQVMALRIVQQPAGNPAFVAALPETLTQFSLANPYLTIGLLAHNDLAGEYFFQLHEAQKVILIYGDGRLKYYSITSIDSYQALTPFSPFSNFRSLSNPEVSLSTKNVFDKIYGQGDRLVFQTCIAQDGTSAWGRLFVTALPLEISMQNPKTSNSSGHHTE